MKICSNEQSHETLTPRRVADVHFPIPIKAIILVGEEGPIVVRACARDGLHGGNSILDEGGGVFTEKKHGGGPRKLRVARHRKVFIIVEWIIHQSNDGLLKGGDPHMCGYQKTGSTSDNEDPTLRTAGNTHGFASSPRYAPTLRSIFWGKASLSQRSFKANMLSGGSSVTPCHNSDGRP